MKRITQLLIFLSISSFLFYACSSEFGEYKKTESGIYYKFYVQTDSTKIEPGDEMTFDLTYTINDSVFFDTKVNPHLNKQIVPKSQFPGDIYECFSLMSVGDSARFIIEADSFFLKTIHQPALPPFIQPKSKLFVDITIHGLKIKEEIELERQIHLSELKVKEGELIKNFKAEQGITKELIENTGIFYKTLKKGSGSLVKPTDFVTLEYTIQNLEGKSFFNTASLGKKLVLECMGDNYETKGFNMILTKMRKGEKGDFIIPSSLAFGENGLQGRVTPYEPLNYTIKVVGIQKKDDYLAKKENEDQSLIKAESEKISNYVKNNNIKVAPRESGLYYIETKEGVGDFPKSGNKVKVHYTLYTLEGKKIDSSHDRNEAFTFNIDKGQVITGWNEAVKLMKEGGKATLILPSKIAYKDKKRSAEILPYTPLLFEIELIEIVK